MLNTIKNIVVIAALLAVGYGVHVVLNGPVAEENAALDDSDQWDSPLVDMGQADALRPEVSLDATGPGAPSAESLPGDMAISASGDPLPPIDPEVSSRRSESAPTSPPAAELSHAESDAAEVAVDTGPEPPTADARPDSDPTLPMGTADTAASGQVADHGPPPADDHQTDVEASTDAGQSSSRSGPETETWASLAESVQQQLDRGELAEALSALSRWYRRPATSDDHKVQLHPLLDQLAGTVIYSRQHRLEPPYAVQDHETLDQIARRFEVPMSLLAKINGIAPPYDLAPGETLKVVHGPFSAETSLSRHELTLFLGPLYAGRFSVRLGSDFSSQQGLLEVAEKLTQKTYLDRNRQEEIAPGSPDNPYGQYWIGLRDVSGGPGSMAAAVGLHGKGKACGPDDTRGCIGLEPRDAEDLYSILSIGSRVRITR